VSIRWQSKQLFIVKDCTWHFFCLGDFLHDMLHNQFLCLREHYGWSKRNQTLWIRFHSRALFLIISVSLMISGLSFLATVWQFMQVAVVEPSRAGISQHQRDNIDNQFHCASVEFMRIIYWLIWSITDSISFCLEANRLKRMMPKPQYSYCNRFLRI